MNMSFERLMTAFAGVGGGLITLAGLIGCGGGGGSDKATIAAKSPTMTSPVTGGHAHALFLDRIPDSDAHQERTC